MAYIIEVIKENAYWILFVTTLLDHSGVPIPIISVGMLTASTQLNVPVLFLIANMALLLIDLVLMVMGIYIRKNHTGTVNRFSLFYSLERKVVDFGDKILKREVTVFYLFGKFIPYIGKFLPFFMGYSYGLNKSNLTLLILGNNIYIVTFYLLGLLFGNLLVKYSFLVAFFCLLIFVAIYTIVIKYKQKNW